jgi:integrase/recombinase XerD
VLATAYNLKVFFNVVGKEPSRVSTADVFTFLTAQRAPRRGFGVVRLEDGEAGLSSRTIKRRLASVSGLFAYLAARDDVELRRNPRNSTPSSSRRAPAVASLEETSGDLMDQCSRHDIPPAITTSSRTDRGTI